MEELSSKEMSLIEGGIWVQLPDGTIIWVPDDETDEEPPFLW